MIAGAIAGVVLIWGPMCVYTSMLVWSHGEFKRQMLEERLKAARERDGGVGGSGAGETLPL